MMYRIKEEKLIPIISAMEVLKIVWLLVNVIGTQAIFETEASAKNFTDIKYSIRDCTDLKAGALSGVYKINPEGTKPFKVYCDMKTDGGGWTVFQRRLDGSVDFFRGWEHYRNGFGNLSGEFWLGNDKLHALTSQGQYHLRVDLTDFDHSTRYANYQTFIIGDPDTRYKLRVGDYSGSAGDSLSYHNGQSFSTKDNDKSSDCTARFKGGWWYYSCFYSNINGMYFDRKCPYAQGIIWRTWKDFYSPMKESTMKIKRVIF